MKGESSCYICGKDGRVSVIKPLMILGTVFMAAISFGDGTTTDINTIKEDLNANDAPVYNLNGQRLQSPVKGINIINGKKVIK